MTQFEESKYLQLSNFVDQKTVDLLTERLFQHRDNKKSQSFKGVDSQVEKADSFYFNASLHDDMVAMFHQRAQVEVEKIVGKKLIPSYVYARIYKKGSELEKHKDRAETEYSLTVNLNASSKKAWPIYFKEDGKQEVACDLNPGDAVIYKGMELEHWRNPLGKRWHAQMFLHYVDANGPYAGKALVEQARTDNPMPLPETTNYWLYSSEADSIPDDICKYYIEQFKTAKSEKASVGLDSQGRVDENIRKVKHANLPTWTGITSYLVAAAHDANFQNWNYAISKCNQSEYLKYTKTGKYETHTDYSFVRNRQSPMVRKLTALALLNDNFKGGKFYLMDNSGNKFYPEMKAGSIIIFPSYLLHGCEPITRGTRHAVVAWMEGPEFR